MNSNKKLLSFLTAVSAIAPGAWSVPAQLTSPNPAALARRDLGLKGQATFYGGNVQGGACSFSTFTLPPGIFSTALAGPNWNTSGNCGGCVAVQGPKNTNADPIIAMIVDKCPDGDCTENHLDLFPDAFAAIGDPNAGVIPISWDYVECPDDKITGPLSIHMKSGVSAYWFSAQVVGAKRRTAKMEVSGDGGKTWLEAQRMDYNFFQLTSGVGSDKVSIRVTSHVGTQVVVNDVAVEGDKSTAATANYQ